MPFLTPVLIMALILHVTEALGTGVAHTISQLAKNQANDGFDVALVHSLRPETPPPDQLDRLFPPPIRRIHIPMVTPVSPLKDARDVVALAKLFRQLQPDVIHLHSSKAGVLGRVAAFLTGYGKRTFYSPHGFAFLREDVSSIKRTLYLIFERIAAFLRGTLVACSESEQRLAQDRVNHPRVVLVENGVEIEHIEEAKGSATGRLRIVTSGRLCYQKAPWRFRDLARNLADLPVDFVWIGSGDFEKHLSIPDGHSVALTSTGWLDRADVLMEVAQSDIFVMTSLWEGMPLSLIEAQAAGLPAVVPDVIGCRDVVRHGETGFVCKSDDELGLYLRKLIDNRELRQVMGRAARNMARERFNIKRMHHEMLMAYGMTTSDASDQYQIVSRCAHK
jgi:glycosyltransferase involved in cell wall biosynthesis